MKSNKYLRPLEKIDALPEAQRQQLAEWLLSGISLDKVVEQVKAEFHLDIPRTNLHRFRKRCEVTDYLDTSEDSAHTRAELITAAASGKPRFGEATVNPLEKHAFELAHAPQEPDAMDAL